MLYVFKKQMRAQGNGFTLIELLVVMSIISLLIALLLPALSKTRESADNVKCQVNLRHIGQGLQVYINESNGRLMPLQNNSSFFNAMWMTKLAREFIVAAPEDGSTGSPFMCPSGTLQVANVSTDPASQTTDPGYALFAGDSLPLGGNKQYAVNYAVNGTATSGLSSWDATRPVSEWFPFVFWSTISSNPKPDIANMYIVSNPVRLPLVFDGLWAHNQKAVRFTLRHNTGATVSTNAVFLDGHVRILYANDIPKAGDNLSNKTVLNTDNSGKWSVTLLAKPIP